MDDPYALVAAGRLYLEGWRPRGKRFVALSNSGASCVMAADAADELGLPLAEFPPAAREQLAAVLPGSLRFVAKKELQRVPLLGRAMRSSGHVFIDRQNRQAAFGAYDEAAAAIRSGISAVVFPEGTRSRTGNLQPFKKGPFVLAIAARVPLVPVYCAGTFTLLPKGHWRIRSHPVALLFGRPIDTTGMAYESREQLMTQTRAAIELLRADAARVLGSR